MDAARAVEINLTDATLNQIAKWVRQYKLPDTLVDLFDSRKLKAPYFFIDSKAAEKARTTELRDLKFTPLEITAINNNIHENKGKFEYEEVPEATTEGPKQKKFKQDGIKDSWCDPLSRRLGNVAQGFGATSIVEEVHYDDSDKLIEQAKKAKRMNDAIRQAIDSEYTVQHVELLAVSQAKASRAIDLCIKIMLEDPTNKKNQELLKFAQQVLAEASRAGSCSVSMGPEGKGSVGSGGSNGPMDIMASEYADVIGFLDYSETEVYDRDGKVTHKNKKSKISPKHYSEWKRNGKPKE